MPITRRTGPNGEPIMDVRPDENQLGGVAPPVIDAPAEGNRQGPRDAAPPPPAPPQAGPGPGPGPAPHGAPQRPMEPQPIAMSPPQPFTPMASSLSPTQTVSTQPGGSITRRGLGPSPGLLGSAGGLLGGGLGVPGQSGRDDMGPLLAMLFKMANR